MNWKKENSTLTFIKQNNLNMKVKTISAHFKSKPIRKMKICEMPKKMFKL